MPTLSLENLLLVAAFVVPGAISMQVYRLKVSTRDQPLADSLFEAIVFGIANFAIMFWVIDYAIELVADDQRRFYAWMLIVLSFFIAPVVWPFLLVGALTAMERWRWIQPRARTSWDHFFGNLREGCFIVVHLADGSFIAGRFGRRSHAGGYPEHGHLFIEELWDTDSKGQFTGVAYSGQGIILRPSDYKFVRVSTGGSDGGPEERRE